MNGCCGLDFKDEVINKKLKSGQLAVNSSLERSREPDESQSTRGHFLIWKENNNFHLPHCEDSFVIQLSETLGREV